MSTGDFLVCTSTMRGRIQAYDWSASSLGPPEAWPQDLHAVLRIVLRSKFPTCVAWGPELIMFYNDAYLDLRGSRPEALGRPLSEAWKEIWGTVGPLVRMAFQGEAAYVQDVPVGIVQRKGHPEETWWTGSFSPIVDEVGTVGGVAIILQETTERVLTERRLRFLVEMSTRLRSAGEARDVMAIAAEMLGRHLRAGRVAYVEIGQNGNDFAIERSWMADEAPSRPVLDSVGNFGSYVEGELRSGRTIRVDDVTSDPRMSGSRIAAEFLRTGRRSVLTSPLVRDDRLMALLYVDQVQPRRWRDDEVALVQEVAERTWVAVRRTRAETALKQSEERFRQFAEHSTTVLWIIDIETRQVEYLSPAYEDIWGEPVEAALHDPDHWARTVHPDDRARAGTAIERALRGEEGTHEYHIIRPDGGVRWIRDTFFPIRDEHGRIRRAGGITQDLTQHDGSMVYVVDGDDASRRDLCLLLQGAGYEVKTFDSAQSFSEVASVLVPGCVMLDIRRPEAGGLTLLRDLKARRTGLPVIVIGEARGDVGVGVRAMKAGAVDFLNMPYRPEQLLDALASAQATIVERAEQDEATGRVKALIGTLPPREREVLDGLLAGGTNKTIARELGISPRTVEAHRARIMERLGAHSLPELVQIAVMAGLQPRAPEGADL